MEPESLYMPTGLPADDFINRLKKRITDDIGPLVGNTHSESTSTGKAMTDAYHHAQKIVKHHVNADENDILIFTGTGMTSALAKLQRILGLKVPEQAINYCIFSNGEYRSAGIFQMKTDRLFLLHIQNTIQIILHGLKPLPMWLFLNQHLI